MFARVIESISTISGWLSGIGIYVMVIIVFIDTMLRYLFGKPTNFADTLSVYSMIFITFLGAAWTTKLGKHVSFDLLFASLSPRTKLWIHAITCCLATITLAIVSWFTVSWVIYTYKSGYISASVVGEEMWIPFSVIPLGLIFWTLQYIVESLKGIEILRNHYRNISPGSKGGN